MSQNSDALKASGDERVARLWNAPIAGYSGTMLIHPIHLVLAALTHWANWEQAAIVDYLHEDHRKGVPSVLFPGRGR